MTVDESHYEGVQKVSRKDVTSNEHKNNDSLLLSSTLIMTGVGKAVVCCVGANSRRGIIDDKMDTESKTPLQVKLENLGTTFTLWGIFGAIAILIALVVN